MTDRKPSGHRFPLSVIGDTLRLYHRFLLSQRDVQELLHVRGVQVSHETLRQWNIKFAPLRHREPRRGSRWFLDEVYVEVGGEKHWLWRDVNEHGAVLDLLLPQHRDTRAARSFFTRLLSEYEVPEVVHTDSAGATGRAFGHFACSTPWSASRSFLRPVATTWSSNRINPHGSRSEANWASTLGGERKRSLPCMPESRTFTATPGPRSPSPSDEAIHP